MHRFRLKKRQRIWLTLISILCLGIGVIFLFQYPLTVKMEQALTSSKTNALSPKRWHQVSVHTLQANQKKKGNFNTSSVHPVNFFDLVHAQVNHESLPLIGGLAYPAVGIHLPIFNGDGYDTMLYGAGTMKADEQMGKGNYALASHHVSNVIGHSGDALLFSPLVKAQKGQKIYLTDKSSVFEYEVETMNLISEQDSEAIDDRTGQQLITLVTCAKDDHFRIVVQGKLMQVNPYNASTAKVFESQVTAYR